MKTKKWEIIFHHKDDLENIKRKETVELLSKPDYETAAKIIINRMNDSLPLIDMPPGVDDRMTRLFDHHGYKILEIREIVN